MVGDTLVAGLTQNMTRTESIALIALLEHIGVPLDNDVAEQPVAYTTRTRKWTRAQKTAHSKRMKAYWRTRRSSK